MKDRFSSCTGLGVVSMVLMLAVLAITGGCADDEEVEAGQSPVAYVSPGPSSPRVFQPVRIGMIQGSPGDWMGRSVVVNGVVTVIEEPGVFVINDIDTRTNQLMVIIPRNPQLITSRLNNNDVVQVSGTVQLFTASMLNTYSPAFSGDAEGPRITADFYMQYLNRPALVATTVDWLSYTRP